MEELGLGDPQRIGSYRLLGRLGRGGMGQVFLGQSPGGRRVAVKVIRPELADSPDFRRRFAREVVAAQRVSGIFTAPLVDADPDAPAPWLVTAYVDGPSLAEHVERNGAMSESDTIRLGCALAEGLAAVHAAGIVHRDLKPSNVLLASDGPRIIDFGISRAAEATSLTQSGLVMGSPGFMSPEQAQGLEVSSASDVFSLGAVLTFAATGVDPFGTGAASTLLYRVVHAEPALDAVPAGLRDVVRACMSKNPAERPAPAGVLAMMASLSNRQPALANDAGLRTYPAGPASAGHRATEPAAPGKLLPDGGASSAALTTMRKPVLAADISRHHRRGPWIALAAAIVLAAGGAAALIFHYSGDNHAARSSQQTTAGGRTPKAVVEAYYAAINAHNWRKAWLLGGKNLSPSYAGMVAGFRHTSHDVITSMTVDGNAVTVRIRAYETTGAVQVYVLSYAVSGSIISSGHQTLLSTQMPCPHIQYGADGTAGPLFCADGLPNPPVLAYYRAMHLRVLSLGLDATPARVLRAMCFDMRQHSTYPIETAAYDLAQKINGWSFATSPAQEMLDGACG